MKGLERRKTEQRTPKSSGIAEVAIWKDNPDITKFDDIFTQYSKELFFDFTKPLFVFDSIGWSSNFQAESKGDGFFVITNTQSNFRR